MIECGKYSNWNKIVKNLSTNRKGLNRTKHDFEEQYPLSQKIIRSAGEAVRDFSMIKENDKILIGLSGGKDSLILSLLLAILKKRSPVKFDLFACVIDQSNGELKTDELLKYMDILGIPLRVEPHATYEIIEVRQERSPCSLCANFRRGLLATVAHDLDCNVIALGHHKDDVAQTVLMNLCYGGHFKCFRPNLYMTRTKLRVIRPLVYVEERNIALEAIRLQLPVTSSCCPYGDDTKRVTAKRILSEIEKEVPSIKSNIIHALKNATESETWKM